MAAYDLLIQGGTVIDPAVGLNARRDVAIAGGKVAAVEPSIAADQAAATVDASGKLVVPGLIDLHAHVFPGYGDGADPERDCLRRGTTTIYDGGTVGMRAFDGLRRYVIEPSRGRIKAWLNISSVGLIDTRVGELMNLNAVDAEGAAEKALANPDTIVGFKIRVSGYVAGGTCKPALRQVLRAAELAGLPIMVHIGESFEPLPEVLGFLRPGDVVTHSLTGRRHGIIGYDGNVLPAVREARERGIFFDAAHGRLHFGFVVIRRAMEQGFLPDSLSTDVTVATAANPAFHLPQIMSKLLALGLTVPEVIPLATSNTARYLKREREIGTLQPGALGDVAILELVEGGVTLSDNEGQSVHGTQRLQPWKTVRAGQVFDALEGV